ncbi:methyltransferase domain-containing protein [Streptomyces bambusae]|uniref:class I SAM-dependent methyltransferase n=1 Tax=Streptomyces bambusae TaxID=1550616 RepID=UPI001CFCA5E7|nr:class I SAM-dependent methyltransferase [Streptomyces bambusae]MCB5165649.1 methyltransferase domain-containing protein [Streptomyces bambusae]
MTVDLSHAPTATTHVASIYNSAVAAWAVSAAWELGALDALYEARTLDAEEFAVTHGLDPAGTTGMFRALSAVGLVERIGARVTANDAFDAVYHNKSFFHWLSIGSAELFREMPSVLRNENRKGDYYRRDAAAIAYACREIDHVTYAPTFWSALDRVDFDVTHVADLGCGSGGRLMDLMRHFPGARGIGVDIAPPSIEVAKQEVAANGLAPRTEFFVGDVLRLERRPEFDEVELLTCFMMGHDFWPRENCIATLRRLREVFPKAKRFLIGDATRTALPDTQLPVFTLGFELGHDLMGTFIPTIENWESVFAAGGWDLVRTNRIEMTVGEVIFELA